MAEKNSSVTNSLDTLEKNLEEYFVEKAPFQIPKGGKEFIVTFAPWLVLIGIVLSLPGIFALFGFSAMMSPFMMGMRYSFGPLWWLSTLLMAGSVVFMVMALNGLFKRTMQGWRYIYYSMLIGILASLVRFDVIGAVVSAVVGFYILFQVKSMYK